MDEIDLANIATARHQQQALANQQAAAQEAEQPLVIEGVRHCIDCGDIIPKARLDARPESVRCIDCKDIKEQRDRRHG